MAAAAARRSDRAEWPVIVAEEEDAELIVVSSRGRGGALKAALLATELIGSAPFPVLVVPPGAATRA